MRSASSQIMSGSADVGAVLVVVGAILGGGAVVVGAGGLEEPVELRVGRILRAHEHQVLEQVGEAGAAGLLVTGADVVPDVGGDDGDGVILVDDEGQSVGQGVDGGGDAQRRVLRRGECRGPGEGECEYESAHRVVVGHS